MGANAKAGRPNGFYDALQKLIGPQCSMSEWNGTHSKATVLRIVRQAEKDCGLVKAGEGAKI